MPITPRYSLTSVTALLSERWTGLTSDAVRTAEQVRAELALGLHAGSSAYVGPDAERLAHAIALQINFQLARGETPDVMKTTANAKSGLNETYRDRIVDPEAAAIVGAVTGVQQVRFTPVTAGV